MKALVIVGLLVVGCGSVEERPKPHHLCTIVDGQKICPAPQGKVRVTNDSQDRTQSR